MSERIQLFKPIRASVSGGPTLKAVTISNSTVTLATANGFTDEYTSVVLVEVLTDAIYVTFDASTTPSSSTGNKLAAGYRDIWSVAMWNQCKAIRVTTDAVLTGQPGNY